jgi:hypothetical protein
MNAVTAPEPVSAATLEHVIGTGDLAKLSTQQRVEYYRRTCETIGINPLTRPFRFLSLNGQLMLYATRDLTDQLRQLHKVRISIVDKVMDGDLFIVTARATMPDGRQDEDVGAVTIGRLQGDARANAVMKAMTKAKRRVTLSICGLGFTDESELETIPGAKTFDADAEPPPAPIRAAAAGMAREARIAKLAPTYDEQPQPPVVESPAPAPSTFTDEQWQASLTSLRGKAAGCTNRAQVAELGEDKKLAKALLAAPQWVQDEISDILADAYARFDATDSSDWPGIDPEKATA